MDKLPHSLSALACGCMSRLQAELVCPSIVTEVAVPGEVHLHALISSTAADNVFCVEPGPLRAIDAESARRTTHASGPAAIPQLAPAQEPCSTVCWHNAVQCASMAWVLRAISSAQHPGRASCISRAVASAQDGLPSMDISSAPAAMLGSLARGPFKALFMEDRTAYGVCLDVPAYAKLKAGQLQWLLQQSGEYSSTVHGRQLYGERLEQLPCTPRQRPTAARPISTVLVTGGTHGLGLQYARDLATPGCQSLVLTSRTAMLAASDLACLADTGQFKICCSR